MSRKIKIASDASILLGASPIQSFEDDSTESLAARAMYDDLYEQLLSHRQWSFAKSTVPLPQLQKPAIDGFKYVYRLPADILKIINVDNGTTNYRLVKRRELHSVDQLYYITASFKVPEEELPSDFVLAFKYLLAAAMCPIITNNATMAQLYDEKGSSLLVQAADNDAVQQPLSYSTHSPLLDSINGGF